MGAHKPPSVTPSSGIMIRDIHIRSLTGGHVNSTAALMGDRVTPKQAYEAIVTGSDKTGNFTKRRILPTQPSLDEVLELLANAGEW